jgi:hypothetical protein
MDGRYRYVTVGGDDTTRLLQFGFYNGEYDNSGPIIEMSYDDAEPLMLSLVSILRREPR